MTYEWIISNAFVRSLQSLSRVKRLISPISRLCRLVRSIASLGYAPQINLFCNRHVQKSPEIGTKCARKECEVPVPAKLVKKLKAWKVKSDKTCKLMFPTSGCNPNLDFLDCLKACAERSEKVHDKVNPIFV